MEIQIFKTSKPIFGQIEELNFVLYVICMSFDQFLELQ